jgi:hypothetical protein
MNAFSHHSIKSLGYISGGLKKLVKPISDKTPKFIRKGFLS